MYTGLKLQPDLLVKLTYFLARALPTDTHQAGPQLAHDRPARLLSAAAQHAPWGSHLRGDGLGRVWYTVQYGGSVCDL